MNGSGRVGPLVHLEVDAAVATLRLDNPPVNALSDDVFDSLDRALSEVADSQVRAIVITGTGEKAFAAGADLPKFRDSMGDPEHFRAHTARTRRVLDRLARTTHPTIAAIQASAVGGGLELALCCDLAIAAENARLGLPEVGLGLIPGAGGTQRLGRRIGTLRATELILTGRLLKAPEALDMGLISAVASPGEVLDEARSLASKLAAKPALAVRAALGLVRAGADVELARGLDDERDAFLEVLAGDDAREGVEAFLERRDPNFRHR